MSVIGFSCVLAETLTLKHIQIHMYIKPYLMMDIIRFHFLDQFINNVFLGQFSGTISTLIGQRQLGGPP